MKKCITKECKKGGKEIMYRRIFLIFMALLLVTATLCWADDDGKPKPKGKPAPSLQSGQNTDYQRHRETLQLLQDMVKMSGSNEIMPQMPTGKTTPPYPPSIVNPAVALNPLFPPGIGFNPVVDYTLPNFSQSPSIRKFVDSLPGLGAANANNLGQYIPIATVAPGGFYPDSDYYELGAAQYTRKLHSDLPPTTLRGYYQKGDAATDPALGGKPQYLGPAVLARTFNPAMPPGGTWSSFGAANGRPVRLRFENHLPTSVGGADALPFPVDETVMGSGQGPMDLAGNPCDYGLATCAKFTQNRIAIHLHGGHTPGMSDGTPHQWWTPAGDPIPGNAIPGFPWGMQKGPAFQNVPDMVNGSVVGGVPVPCIGGAKCFTPNGNDGIGTLYYTNQQSPRLLFFHDHAWGITRLNVYDGTAAPYLIVDKVEDDLIDGTNVSGVFTAAGIAPTQILPNLGGVYRYGIPLVFQDKAFVNDTTTDAIRNAYPAIPRQFPLNYSANPNTLAVDPLWASYSGMPGGNLWLPHEYMPIENVFDLRGYTDTGRWDYGAFMIPAAIPKYLTLPSPSVTPEAFMDTAVVNGTAFPYVNLPPDAIRFRILAAGNDRSWNLQLYSAAVGPAPITFGGTACIIAQPIASTIVRGGVVTGVSVLSPGAGCTAGLTAAIADVAGHAPTTPATITPIVSGGSVTGFTITNPGAGYLAGTICKGQPASPPGVIGYTWADLCTEVSMVQAIPNQNYPTWPLDSRDGGVPDPTTQGPPWLQIGNEAGFLAQLAVWPQQPVAFERIRQNLPFAGVTYRTLYLMGAMRADVIVDFHSFNYANGDILIVYNDAPAPMPMFQTLYDYYTDSPDLSPIGALPTPAGFGPNTRTLMQIRITGAHTPGLDYGVTAVPGFDESPTGAFLPAILSGPFGPSFTKLQTVLPKAFAAVQEKPIVPQLAYNAAYCATPSTTCFATTNIYGQGYMESINISGTGQPVAKIVTALPGAGYAVAPSVQIVPGAGGCTTLPTATAGINPIGAVTLVTAGTGYTSIPTVTLGPPLAGGVQATAAATVSGGVVTGITIVEPGSNYSVSATAIAPTCTITGGGATTAATCSVTLATAGTVGSITITNPGAGCINQPLVFLLAQPGDRGAGATADALLKGALAPTGKALTEGFDPDFSRINILLGSVPNVLTPTVGAGPVIGIAKYIDPPTEILNNGETVLWRITHLGVDSHVMHFHLFDLQVINRVDYANTVKQPYLDELGWRESIRTNPFEDIFIALKPTQMVLPFPEPHNIRPLDPSTPVGSTTNFLPIAPPIGVPAVAQTTNTLTDFGFEYVWHCHILAHEEFDMMRPTVFQIAPIPTASAPSVAWNPTLGKYHVAIRRADNRIYIGTANVDGVLNLDFAPLPTGTTATAPQIAWDPTHNKLIIANKGFATTNLFVASMNADGTGFSGYTLFAVGTTAAPAIAWNATTGKLQYAILGAANTVWVGSLNFNGTAFSGASQIALTSATAVGSAPAIAIATTGTPGTIYLTAKSTAASLNILVGSVAPSLSLATFSGWKTWGGVTPSGTTAVGLGIAWNGASNKAELVSKGNATTNVLKAAVDAALGVFTAWTQVPGAVSTDTPAIGMDPLLAPLNIFTINGGNISGYTTAAL
jgi:FtsP/CotA-like multicopper oxidase with cupredoxin domain